MTQLQDLKDAVASLTGETADLKSQNTVLIAKVDGLVTLTDLIKDRLVQLAEAGTLPPDELSSLTTAINGARDSIHAITAETLAEAGKVDDATARDQLPSDDEGGDTGTQPADGSAPTGGDGEAPSDGSPVENTPETP